MDLKIKLSVYILQDNAVVNNKIKNYLDNKFLQEINTIHLDVRGASKHVTQVKYIL